MTTFHRLIASGVLVLAAACSPGDGTGYVAAAAPHHRQPALTVEQLAAKVGCEPAIQVDAAELRQGHCVTGDGEFFLTTFATQAGKDAWMDTAPEYNPHLVGPLWTVLSTRRVLDRLRARLGGDLHLKDHRTSPPSGVRP
ncbi:hypothetical protein OIE66_10705 [Nonomuraea sp. NBC_01738]|uniref:hypothetical protein n=1 Tax=Nonomuraea sp. NBC_01738 TaxID=2976003 RepID=UPI002E157BDA|nr:hypothetical protein OIE66_10705 [Nonomuraea sp. NBC_01738]